jgi:uncharacterized protein (TIGR03435 family)
VSYPPGGGFRATLTLHLLMSIAYDITYGEQIVGGPSWVREQSFVIDAKSAGPATREETDAMLRTLLEDRFGLIVRRDPQGKSKAWVLRMAREDQRLGPGIRRSEIECIKVLAPPPITERRLRPGQPVPCGTATNLSIVAGGSVPIPTLAFSLQLRLGAEVVERTGLTGNVDFYAQIPYANVGQQDTGAVSLFTAVQEELGMKLEREEITRELFVIERVSQPTPN